MANRMDQSSNLSHHSHFWRRWPLTSEVDRVGWLPPVDVFEVILERFLREPVLLGKSQPPTCRRVVWVHVSDDEGIRLDTDGAKMKLNVVVRT